MDELNRLTTEANPDEGPEVAMTAISSGRIVTPSTCQGSFVLLLFHNHRTLHALEEVHVAVRNEYPDALRPIIASIADLDGVPKILRRAARSAMHAGYARGAEALPAGLDPADYVIILPDWDGRVTADFDLRDVGKMAAIILLDGEWRVRAGTRAPGQARTHWTCCGGTCLTADSESRQRPLYSSCQR